MLPDTKNAQFEKDVLSSLSNIGKSWAPQRCVVHPGQ